MRISNKIKYMDIEEIKKDIATLGDVELYVKYYRNQPIGGVSDDELRDWVKGFMDCVITLSIG